MFYSTGVKCNNCKTEMEADGKMIRCKCGVEPYSKEMWNTITLDRRGRVKMKIAYIAGPYRSKWGRPGIFFNILKARKVAKKYWRLGFAVVCPHLNSALMDGLVPDRWFLEGDKQILSVCDVVVMCRGWTKSQGSVAEHERSMELGKEIRYEGVRA